VAAWQPPGSSKPEVIPPRAFGSDTIAHLPAGALWHKTNGRIPAFAVEARGEVPLAGSEQPLVRVQFKDVSARGVIDRARVRWDFGDGYTTEVKEPLHIYLSPGLYTVKMTVQGTSRTLETVNRVPITRPVLFPDPKKRPDQLTSYRRILDKHDPKKLKFENVLQLVRAYEQLGEIPRAAATGRTALLSDRRPEEDTAIEDLVRVVGPLFRDRLDDPEGALSVWQAAAKAIRREDGKLRCEAEAADILLHDLLRPREAKVPLDSATGRLNKSSDPTLARRLYRVWGDWYARGGDRKAARQAYARASTFRSSPGDVVKDSARRGAFSRSIEAYLRTKDLDRAREELRHWQDEFPADKLEGYLPLLQARYRVAREKYPQAIAVATDLLTINPESPYADRLVYLAAECEEKLGRTERALADYRALLTDYPGSLLVKKAKEKLSRSVVDPPKDPPRKGKKER
jgi:PKD repeat protein